MKHRGDYMKDKDWIILLGAVGICAAAAVFVFSRMSKNKKNMEQKCEETPKTLEPEMNSTVEEKVYKYEQTKATAFENMSHLNDVGRDVLNETHARMTKTLDEIENDKDEIDELMKSLKE